MAAFVGGYIVFGKRTSVNEQVCYVIVIAALVTLFNNSLYCKAVSTLAHISIV